MREIIERFINKLYNKLFMTPNNTVKNVKKQAQDDILNSCVDCGAPLEDGKTVFCMRCE